MTITAYRFLILICLIGQLIPQSALASTVGVAELGSLVRADSSNSERLDRIWLEDAIGCTGDTLEIALMLENSETTIDAFTVDVSFDPTMLDYFSCLPGSLNPEWVMFACTEYDPGTVRGAGFSLTTSIPAGSVGSLVIFTFTVTCPGCQDNDSSSLSITRLLDDIAFFSSTPGTFTYYCGTGTPVPSPTVTPTATGSQPPTTSPTATEPAATFTPSFTPAPSHTPVSSPTRTPTPFATEPPTVAPTPGAELFILDLTITKQQPDCYTEGDQFGLIAFVHNPGRARAADLYCVLDVYGSYYFYPTWTTDLQYQRLTVPVGTSSTVILNFVWPYTEGEVLDLLFWAVYLEAETLDLESNVENVTFCYGS